MKKRMYIKPELKSIKIDNQISMVMMSPPTGPNESISIQQQSTVSNPYKIG
jgi:hypothetical protein